MVLCVVPNPSVDTLIETGTFNCGKVNRISRERAYPGGKGTHVALALHELGIDTQLMGIWAGDTGKWIREQCAASGIECTGTVINGRNRTCYTISESGSTDETELLGQGPYLSSVDFDRFLKEFETNTAKVEVISMSGSWPEHAPDDAYARLIRTARKGNKQVYLDCSGLQLKHALQEHPFGIHINVEEGTSMFNTGNPVEIANRLSRYCEVAAVTAGADGLYLKMGSLVIHSTCKVDPVTSAVGSGDCLTAGLISAYLENSKPEEIAARAVSCGAANCLREELGMLYKKDVERLKKSVRVKIYN